MIELVWRERLPLGMNLLLNDESGFLKVVDFPRGSQARLVCENRGLDPDLFKGARIAKVNGSDFDDQEDLFDALKDPARPKTVLFEIAEEADAKRVHDFVTGQSKGEEPPTATSILRGSFTCRIVEFDSDEELGIEFSRAHDDAALIVTGFRGGDDGIVLAAERSGRVRINDMLTHVNQQVSLGLTADGQLRALKLLEEHSLKRPLSLSFTESYAYEIQVEKSPLLLGMESSSGPTELILKERIIDEGRRRIVIQGFHGVAGTTERAGILIGDYLVFINGMPVGAGCRWLGEGKSPTLAEVCDMLRDPLSYPIGLTFARPQQQRTQRWSGGSSDRLFDDTEAQTICVTAESFEDLGLVLSTVDVSSNGASDIIVKDLMLVPGAFQKKLKEATGGFGVELSCESVNGEFVPSFATPEMVRAGLNRSWSKDGRVEIRLVDDAKKSWIHDSFKSIE
jgi:hypothetical protein